MFRLQDKVPSVYVEQSRDFQLLCRLMDCSQGALKYDIDTIVKILDASTIRDSLLSLLCTKVGFFPRVQIEADILKYIVAAFPYIMRYKGTKKGIEYAVNAVLKSEFTNIYRNIPQVIIKQHPDYIIEISTALSTYNRQALEEVLYYIKPIGYDVVILNTVGREEDRHVQAMFTFKDELKVPTNNDGDNVSISTTELAKIVNNIPDVSNSIEVDPEFIAFGMVTGDVGSTSQGGE